MPSRSSRARVANRYSFQLLRYAPNMISGEHYNIAVLLYGNDGRIIDARFASEFRRLACHPAVELEYLEALREEFEEQRMLGTGFGQYIEELAQHLSDTLQLSRRESFLGTGAVEEMERLISTYVATPAPVFENGEQSLEPGSRAFIQDRLESALDRQGVFMPGGVEKNIDVQYGGPRLNFRFDYGYRSRSGRQKYLHALGRRNELQEASRLCLVYDRLRRQREDVGGLTAVIDESASEEARELLATSAVETAPVGRVGALARRVRSDLALV